MGKYAAYRQDGPAPWRIVGWYDTDAHPGIKPPAPYVAVADAIHAARMGTHFAVAADGHLVQAHVPAPLPPGTRAGDIPTVTLESEDAALEGRTLTLDSRTLLALHMAAVDVGTGLGLPGGADTWQFAGLALSAPAVTSLYRQARDIADAAARARADGTPQPALVVSV